MQYFSFSAWLTSLHVTTSRAIHIAAKWTIMFFSVAVPLWNPSGSPHWLLLLRIVAGPDTHLFYSAPKSWRPQHSASSIHSQFLEDSSFSKTLWGQSWNFYSHLLSPKSKLLSCCRLDYHLDDLSSSQTQHSQAQERESSSHPTALTFY